MSDQEKLVIDGLERCCEHGYRCLDCPYEHFGVMCTDHLAHDALELLKEQEPIVPKQQEETCVWTVCGNCSRHLISKWTYCPYCGRKVKWD